MRNNPTCSIIRVLVKRVATVTVGCLFLLLMPHGTSALVLDTDEGVTTELTVATSSGPVKGRIASLTRRFLGIPFAAPPVGELRWKPPAPVAPWSGVREAFNFGNRCPQVQDNVWTSGPAFSEDCLYLNVFAPATGSGHPVMFYIHGGGFLVGDAGDMGIGPLLNGTYLAAYRNVVVVTINYRLGALGFLTHPSLAAENFRNVSGNYGLLDMISALDWVQTNIRNFGGDPGKVMIFGHSAGAAATCALLVSPLAAGKFSSAAIQSGWCGAPRMPERIAHGLTVAASLGCPLTDNPTTAACLRRLTPQQILQIVGRFDRDYYTFAPWITSHTLTAGPTVDGHVLPDRPLTLLQQGNHNHVPLIIGSTKDEFQFFIADLSRIRNCNDHRDYITAQFGADAGAVLAQYPCGSDWTAREASVQAAGDFYFTCPSRRAARAAAASQKEPVYQYLYSYQFQTLPILIKASHLADIPYVFGTYLETVTLPSYLAEQIQQYWSQFAKRGNPNRWGLVPWSRYDRNQDNFLNFDLLVSEERNLKNGKCNFWDTLTPSDPPF
jgi:para-nitrobenzyl esterase